MKSILYPAAGLFVLAASVPGTARAEDAAEQDTIIVTGTVDGYRTVDTTSGTKTNTPILDVPQAISVVTDQQLRDQQVRSVADLVRLIPGISAGQGEGHRDQITLRGNNSTADFFVDGLRDDVQYFRSFYNIDRVEAHKGPNAMVFGRGGGGGIINRITKGALAGVDRVGGTVSADTFGAWYVATDTNVDLGAAALRLNAFYEALNNHRDAFDGDRYAVNPVIGAELSGGVKVQLGYEYVRDDRVVDRGIPSAFAGAIAAPAGPLRGFDKTFFGIRGVNDTDFEAHVVSFRTEAPLTETLKLSVQALYGDYDKLYTNVFAVSPANRTATPPTTAVEAYTDPTTRETLIGQVNLEWRGSTGGIEHVLLAGAEFTDQDTYNERINGFFGSPLSAANRRRTVTLADPVVIPAVQFVAGPTGNSNRAVASRLRQASFYLQDQISFSRHVDLIAGLRYDRFDLVATNLFTNARFARVDDLWSPRVGLVVKPVEAASVYVSYAKSFLPQSGDQFVGLDLTSSALEPETFDNYEIGAKWDIKPGLTATVAVYRLDRGNTRAAGATPGSIVLTGQQRSSGVELGLTGRITDRWQTALGYARTRARITETTSAAPAGRAVAQVPKHQLSLWNRYDVTDRLGFGLGLYHQSAQFATISNVTRLPAWTRIDAAVFFKITDAVEAQVNIENLTDETYFPAAHNDNNISVGAPLNARFTLSARF
jgi:catecholate siderophore receptor